jgi:hypothetical protein
MQKTADAVVLKLEGSVKGPWVEELQKAWLTSAEMAAGEPLNIDLRAVSFADERGRDLLLRLRREGVSLSGCSSFLLHILDDGNTKSERPQKVRSAK